MAIIIDSYVIPEKGKVDFEVKRSFEIKISAKEARQKVRRWLRDEISMLIGAEPPTLVVGVVEVEVTTGEMNVTAELKAAIEQ